MRIKFFAFINSFLFLSGCAVGPNYQLPPTVFPVKYKEIVQNPNFIKHWKPASPPKHFDDCNWWRRFHSVELNALEEKLSHSNQTVANAEAQFRNSQALVDEARASFFPTASLNASITRQKQGASDGGSSSSSVSSSTSTTAGGGTSTTVSGGSVSVGNTRGPFNRHNLSLNASWEPDIWGLVRRQVEASVDFAQSNYAALGVARLSAEASLAQYYFELQAVDTDQFILNDFVRVYKEALRLTKNRFTAGVAAQGDVIQAQSQLETAEAQAINNQINRTQYEHAIAVLLGEFPANFAIKPQRLKTQLPFIPVEIPSRLLERRPDIAQEERLMAQANANIGVAISAYYPVLTLTATGSINQPGFAKWLSLPTAGWTLAGGLAQQLLDGGLKSATVAAARANYDASVANYKQTVLTAFQNVEDNLAALLILKKQEYVLNQAARDARKALQIITNEYKAGTVVYTDVITAQTNAFTAEKAAADLKGLEFTSAVGLIKALGGDWDLLDNLCIN